jgi:hypothetical protein
VLPTNCAPLVDELLDGRLLKLDRSVRVQQQEFCLLSINGRRELGKVSNLKGCRVDLTFFIASLNSTNSGSAFSSLSSLTSRAIGALGSRPADMPQIALGKLAMKEKKERTNLHHVLILFASLQTTR